LKFDPITTEVLRCNFESITEEMGAALIRTAYSTNIRDRRDCSCAIFDPKGRCLAQATHLPIHLGALIWSVQQSLRVFPVEKLKPGDAIITNDPFTGNSHMPDISVFAPVFYSKKLIGIVANMAHHVDIGGSNPGSSSANATELFQEGIRIPPSRIRQRGEMNEELLNIMDANSRTPETNRGDTMAQIAANNTAERRLSELAETYGPTGLLSFAEELMNSTEQRMRSNVSSLIPDGVYEFEDYLEGDGIDDELITLKVSIRVTVDEAVIDFTGTDEQVNGPISCVYGLTKSCVNFVMKAVIDPYCPSNEGAYRPFRIIAPAGTMVNAQCPAATNSSLNVTSQKIADVLIGGAGRDAFLRSI
jgi:N-methylhydantoinase B